MKKLPAQKISSIKSFTVWSFCARFKCMKAWERGRNKSLCLFKKGIIFGFVKIAKCIWYSHFVHAYVIQLHVNIDEKRLGKWRSHCLVPNFLMSGLKEVVVTFYSGGWQSLFMYLCPSRRNESFCKKILLLAKIWFLGNIQSNIWYCWDSVEPNRFDL